MAKGRANKPGQLEPSRAVFVIVLCCGLLGTSFWLGLRAGFEHNAAFWWWTSISTTIEQSVSATAGAISSSVRSRPTKFLQVSRYFGTGVTVNDPSNDQNDLILLSGFLHDRNELQLIRRNGDIVARWSAPFFTLFPHPDYMPKLEVPASEWNIDLHGSLALPDGSVLFNFEYGGLAKLDRCGNVVWTLRRRTHHAIERAEGGGFWVPGRREIDGPSPYPPFDAPLQDDMVLKVSDDGQILAEHSVAKVFYDTHQEALLSAVGPINLATGEWGYDIVHLNKITELTSDMARDFQMFEAGDLLLSLRDRNMLLVVDNNVSRIKWWKIGPWIRQHDPEFRHGGTFVLFNDNLYPSAFERVGSYRMQADIPRVTNIMEVNPASNEAKVIYGGRPGQELLSVVRGKVDVTPRGGLLITEAQGGRVRETAADGTLLWEYVNRYNDEEIAELGEARLYPAGYFTVNNWTCP